MRAANKSALIQFSAGFLALLFFAMLINTASATSCTSSAWHYFPNQLAYFNVSNINWSVNYYGHNVTMPYAYLDLSAYNYSGLWLTLLVSGFNSTHFVGNMTFFPYHNGILIPNKTLLNKTYSCLTVWYRPTVINVGNLAPYYVAENNTLKRIIQVNNSYNNIDQIQLYNVSVSSYNTYFVGGQNDFVTDTAINFNPNTNEPYFLLSNLQGGNVGSVSVIPNYTLTYQQGVTPYSRYSWSRFIFNQRGQRINITNVDTFFPSTRSSFTNANSANMIFMDGYPYPFLANGLVLNGNHLIENSSSATSGIGGYFQSPTVYNLNFYAPNLSSFGGYTLQHYYIVPGYTTNLIEGSPTVIGSPNLTTASYGTWKYKINITNVKWFTNFTTLANFSHPGKAKVISVNNVRYLLINLTHYAEMGSCAAPQITISATPLSLGTIPYAIEACNNQTIHLLLKNLTLSHFTYVNATVFFNSSWGAIGAEYNQSILSSFKQNYTGSGNAKARMSALPTGNYLVQFNQYLGKNDSLNYTGLSGNRGIFGRPSGFPSIEMRPFGVIFNSTNYDTTYLLSTPYLYSYGLAMGNNSNPCYTLSNETVSSTNIWQCIPNFYLGLAFDHTAIGYYPYTDLYNISNVTLVTPTNNAISNPRKPGLPQFPQSNSSPMGSWLSRAGLLNSTARLNALGLIAPVTLYGVTIPIVELIAFVILALITFFGVFSDNHIATIAGIIVLWIVLLGFFNLQMIYLGIIITAIVVIGEIFIPHNKKEVNHVA